VLIGHVIVVTLVIVEQHSWKNFIFEVGVEAMLDVDGFEVSIYEEDQSTEGFSLEVGIGRFDKRDQRFDLDVSTRFA